MFWVVLCCACWTLPSVCLGFIGLVVVGVPITLFGVFNGGVGWFICAGFVFVLLGSLFDSWLYVCFSDFVSSLGCLRVVGTGLVLRCWGGCLGW